MVYHVHLPDKAEHTGHEVGQVHLTPTFCIPNIISTSYTTLAIQQLQSMKSIFHILALYLQNPTTIMRIIIVNLVYSSEWSNEDC